jgi:hypothetical protein
MAPHGRAGGWFGWKGLGCDFKDNQISSVSVLFVFLRLLNQYKVKIFS